MEKAIERAKKTGFLSLKGLGLTELPAEVLELTNLKTLIVSNNPLTELPSKIGEFVDLQVLHAVNCSLTDEGIPETLFGLSKLKEVNFGNNNLMEVASLFSRLSNLQRLDISNNDVLSLEGVENLPENLKTLNLSNNNLSELPPSLAKLEHLKVLRLKGNNFEEEMVVEVSKKGPSALINYL